MAIMAASILRPRRLRFFFLPSGPSSSLFLGPLPARRVPVTLARPVRSSGPPSTPTGRVAPTEAEPTEAVPTEAEPTEADPTEARPVRPGPPTEALPVAPAPTEAEPVGRPRRRSRARPRPRRGRPRRSRRPGVPYGCWRGRGACGALALAALLLRSAAPPVVGVAGAAAGTARLAAVGAPVRPPGGPSLGPPVFGRRGGTITVVAHAQPSTCCVPLTGACRSARCTRRAASRGERARRTGVRKGPLPAWGRPVVSQFRTLNLGELC